MKVGSWKWCWKVGKRAFGNKKIKDSRPEAIDSELGEILYGFIVIGLIFVFICNCMLISLAGA